MFEYENISFTGTVKNYNDQYGFITYEKGDVFFHKSALKRETIIGKGDNVVFKIEPSKKKDGSFQAYEINVTKKSEEVIIISENWLFGVIKWFDFEKGFGVLSTSKGVEYFLHKKKLGPIVNTIYVGDVLMFTGIGETKKSVYSCRHAKSYEDFVSALNQISSKEIVSVEIRGDYTTSKKVSILFSIAKHILSQKSLDEKLKYISDYFNDQLVSESSQVQLDYLVLLKRIFEDCFPTESIYVLSLLFNQYSDLINSYPKFKYEIWMGGYLPDIDLQYVISTLCDMYKHFTIDSLNVIFSRLSDNKEKLFVIDRVIESLQETERKERFNFFKKILSIAEIDDDIRNGLAEKIFNLSDQEQRHQLWLEGYSNKSDLNYISSLVLEYCSSSTPSSLVTIFKRIVEPIDKLAVLNTFHKQLKIIDSAKKYDWMKLAIDSAELDDESQMSLVNKIYSTADDEQKFHLWIDGFWESFNDHFVKEKLINYLDDSNYNLIAKTLTALLNSSAESKVYGDFISSLGVVKSDKKYNQITSLLQQSASNNKLREQLVRSFYSICDDRRKYLLLMDGFCKEVDPNCIAKLFYSLSIDTYVNAISVILNKVDDSISQGVIINLILDNLGLIDSVDKYRRIKPIINTYTLTNEVKIAFLIRVVELCDLEWRFHLWLDNFIVEKDIENIAHQMCHASFVSVDEVFGRVSSKLIDDDEKESVSKQFFEELGDVDSKDKYNRVRALIHTALITKDKGELLAKIYERLNKQCKIYYWLDNYTIEVDLDNLAYQMSCASFESLEKSYTLTYKKLANDIERNDLTMLYLEKIGHIDSNEKFNRVTIWLTVLNEKVDWWAEFLINVFNQCSVVYKADLFITYGQFSNVFDDTVLDKILNELDILYLYDFFIKLIDPLTEKNTTYYYNGYSFLKIHLEENDFLNTANNKYGSSSVFQYQGELLTNERFVKKLSFIKIITNFITQRKTELAEQAKSTIDGADIEAITLLIRNLDAFNYSIKQVCADLGMESNCFKLDIERFVVEMNNVECKLKCWLYDLISHFDFNTYANYYFTLSLQERKIFNKKAKAIMGDSLQKSMLRKREPWTFIESKITDDSSEICLYEATWKSIWFQNGCIKVCMDKQPNYTNSFDWKYSEEKFNFLFEYISGRRLKKLSITVSDDQVLSIHGLENLEEVIWKILLEKEVKEKGNQGIKGIGINKVPVNMIVRNQCIQLLNNLQLKEFEPAVVYERTTSPIAQSVDVSFLYSIPINDRDIAIIWESIELEKSKATHVFKCLRSEYKQVFSDIHLFISEMLTVRSKLNSINEEDVTKKKQMRYLCRIDHDNFDFSKWKDTLYDIVPELGLISQN
jgi:cold shock CspA family protein